MRWWTRKAKTTGCLGLFNLVVNMPSLWSRNRRMFSFVKFIQFAVFSHCVGLLKHNAFTVKRGGLADVENLDSN